MLTAAVRCMVWLQALRVCVTGAAGQIAYSLLYSVAKGDVFGADQASSSTLKHCMHCATVNTQATRRGNILKCQRYFCITTSPC